MFPTRPHTTLVLMALMLIGAVGRARAADALPAGYERMLSPGEDFQLQLEVIPEWAEKYQTVILFELAGTPGYRIIDLEIDWFNKEPNCKEEEPLDHMVSYVEVPNEGDFEIQSGCVAVGVFAHVIEKYWEAKNWRPIDIELYYRRNPYNGAEELVPTYGYVGVENKGKDFAEWDWIPLLPYDALFEVLDDVFEQGWRPYDIEFASDGSGQLVGTALLARDESFFDPLDLSTHVPTMWTFFEPEELPSLANEGWQLLDVEVLPDFKDPLATGAFDADAIRRFGIFVDTSFVELENTFTAMMTDSSDLTIENLAGDNMGFARLIDVERDGYIDGPCNSKGEICEGGYITYTHVWLIPD